MEFMKAIALRQSCRAYTGEQLTDHELKVIIEAANASPVSMGRYDEVKLTVIQNKDLLRKIDTVGAEFFGSPNISPTYGAPTLILISAAASDNPQNPSPYCNAGCIVENMALTAASLDLGAVYILGAIIGLMNHPELFEDFKIPAGFIPVSAFAVGKAAKPLAERELTTSRIAIDFL